jgi:hypothetical protein
LLLLGAWVLVVTLAAGCADGDGPAVSRSEPGRSTASDGATEPVAEVPLDEPAPGFARQCAEAARSLGFAVPCPTRLPLVNGHRAGCPESCLGAVGEHGTVRIFVLDVAGYDDSDSAPETVRHLTVNAFKVDEAPPSPCYEGVPTGTLDANGHEVALLACPPSSEASEASIRHGEGVHAEHLLGYWDSSGVRYTVSVHRTPDHRSTLLERLVSSIELVGP